MDTYAMGIHQCDDCRAALAAESASCTRCAMPVPRRGVVQADGSILLNRIVVDEAQEGGWGNVCVSELSPEDRRKLHGVVWEDSTYVVRRRTVARSCTDVGAYHLNVTNTQWTVSEHTRHGLLHVYTTLGKSLEQNKTNAVRYVQALMMK